MKIIDFTVTEKYSGKEIKSILHNPLGLSSRLVTKLKLSGKIEKNGIHATVRETVICGDTLKLTLPVENSENIIPSDIPLDIIYEDEEILVLNKPAGMPTHPSMHHYSDTLANGVMNHFRDTDFVFRAITRLDSDTSGLVLIAKNRLSADRLCKQMQNSKIAKTYYALCEGKINPECGEIKAPIARAGKSTIERKVSPEGQYAKTIYKLIEYKNGLSLIEVMPITGRTHQIRVHMAHIGFPLSGDFLYGTEIPGERTKLHCRKLEFIHPESGAQCEFTADIPCDFLSVLN